MENRSQPITQYIPHHLLAHGELSSAVVPNQRTESRALDELSLYDSLNIKHWREEDMPTTSSYWHFQIQGKIFSGRHPILISVQTVSRIASSQWICIEMRSWSGNQWWEEHCSLLSLCRNWNRLREKNNSRSPGSLTFAQLWSTGILQRWDRTRSEKGKYMQ